MMNKLILTSLLVALALPMAHAQSSSNPTLDLWRSPCPFIAPEAPGPQLMITMPFRVLVGGGSREVVFNAPACAVLGRGLAMNGPSPTGRYTLDVTLPAAPIPLPEVRMVTEEFALDPATPASTTEAQFTLRWTPVQGQALIMMFESSRVGMDLVRAVTVGNGGNGSGSGDAKTLVVTLPAYRPFTASDRLTVVYGTRDAAVPVPTPR